VISLIRITDVISRVCTALESNMLTNVKNVFHDNATELASNMQKFVANKMLKAVFEKS